MNGYSHGEKEELMDMLESAMAAAGSERDKEKIRRCMEQLNKD